MKTALVVFCLSLLASIASAQSPFPGGVQVNGGWIPCDHPIAIDAGKACGAIPEPAQPPNPVTPTIPNPPAECVPWPNPYTEPARLLACNAKLGPPVPVSQQDFRVGAHYKDPYDIDRMVVLSVTRGLDESTIVTAQWLTASPSYALPANAHAIGDVFAFKAGPTDYWRDVR